MRVRTAPGWARNSSSSANSLGDSSSSVWPRQAAGAPGRAAGRPPPAPPAARPGPGGPAPAAWPPAREAERLDQVVVGAGVQAPHPVVDAVPGRQQQHRRPAAAGPQLPGHLQPVEVGQHDVEHDRVVVDLGGQPQGLGAVPGHVDGVALLLKTTLEQQRQPGLVLGHQEPHDPEYVGSTCEKHVSSDVWWRRPRSAPSARHGSSVPAVRELEPPAPPLWSGACHQAVRMPASPPGRITSRPRSSWSGQWSSSPIVPSWRTSRRMGPGCPLRSPRPSATTAPCSSRTVTSSRRGVAWTSTRSAAASAPTRQRANDRPVAPAFGNHRFQTLDHRSSALDRGADKGAPVGPGAVVVAALG